MQRLYRSLKRKYPRPKTAIYDEPSDALLYAIISENTSERAAQAAIKRFADYFVDLNDLRVSRTEEIVEVLGQDTPVNLQIASALTAALGSVFNQYNTVSLKVLKKIGKRPAREVLERMDGTSRFAVNYCILASLKGHAIPLTKKMIEYLISNQLVHPDADQRQIEGFLGRQISAGNAYEFYALLRRGSESRRPRLRKETASKAKTKAKTKTKKKTKK